MRSTRHRWALLAAAVVGLLAVDARADGDAAKGARVFNKCKACHTIAAGAGNKIGPNLHGVIGRKAGTLPGFNYSQAMRKSGIVWSDETLEKYLANPRKVVPHNRMAFIGLKKESEREDVIAYLKQQASK